MVAKPTGKFERMFAALTRPNLTYRERCVLAIIASHDGAGGAWPSQERIARVLGMTRPAVNAAVQSLAAKGWLKSERRHGNERDVNLYEIAYCEPFEGGPMSVNLTVGEGGPMSGLPFIGEGGPMSGKPDTKVLQDLRAGSTGKSTTKQRRGAKETDTTKQRRPKENQMETHQHQQTWLGGLGGFCRECGYGVPAKAPGCPTCGSEDAPFVCSEAELKSGVLTLPFGLSASGLDTPEGRLLFLSAEGQAGLRDAYAVIFGDKQEGIQQ